MLSARLAPKFRIGQSTSFGCSIGRIESRELGLLALCIVHVTGLSPSLRHWVSGLFVVLRLGCSFTLGAGSEAF